MYATACRFIAGRPTFFSDVLQDRLVQAELRDQLLEPRVLLLQLLELAHLVGLHPRVLLLPAIERLLRNADLPNQVGHRHPKLGLFEHGDDLLDRKLLAFHDKLLPPLLGRSLPKN